MFLEIEYLNKETGELTSRKIRIQKVEKSKNSWLIKAYCYLRNEQRTFTLENIYKATHEQFGEIIDKKNFLREHFVIQDTPLKEIISNPTSTNIQYDILEDLNFSKYCICLTGKSWNKISKTEIYAKLEGFGARTTDSYTNEVNLLIVLGDPKSKGSNKLLKSLNRRSSKENILIINEDYFWTLFNIKIAS